MSATASHSRSPAICREIRTLATVDIDIIITIAPPELIAHQYYVYHFHSGFREARTRPVTMCVRVWQVQCIFHARTRARAVRVCAAGVNAFRAHAYAYSKSRAALNCTCRRRRSRSAPAPNRVHSRARLITRHVCVCVCGHGGGGHRRIRCTAWRTVKVHRGWARLRVMQLNAFVNMHRGFGAKWPIKRMRAQSRMPPYDAGEAGGDRYIYIYIYIVIVLHSGRARSLADSPPKPRRRARVATVRAHTVDADASDARSRSPSTATAAATVHRVPGRACGTRQRAAKARRQARLSHAPSIAFQRPEERARARAHNTLPFLCAM